MALDARLTAALNDEPTAKSMLSELHSQIAVCRDPRALAELLSRYTTVAAARQVLSTEPSRPTRAAFPMRSASPPLLESRRQASIASILRSVQDTQNSIISNIR